MRRALAAAFLLALALHAPTIAQQVGESVNVMPVWTPCNLAADPDCADNPAWRDAWRYGDVFLQRQVEPSTAPSAANPQHVLTGVIDYSAVEVSNDQGIGTGLASRAVRWMKELLARVFTGGGRDAVPASAAQSPGGATGEAWIRLIWSTEGGANGTPFFMPGAPWDTSEAGRTAPYYGIATGASDPVVVAAPDNRFFVTYMAFKRGETNFLMVARFRDENLPHAGGQQSLVFEGFSTIASGNNAVWGTLNDKPSALVVRDPGSPVGYNVYVSYTLFNGNLTGGRFQSQIFVAKSVDGGRTFTSEKVNSSSNQNTGTVLTPAAGGRAAAFFRGFGDTPTVFASIEGPNGFPQQPTSILEAALPTLATFDQGSTRIDATTPETLAASVANVTPRANAFPAAATAADGTIYVVWTECVDVRPGSATFGTPRACALGGAEPRIVLKYSRDGGATWLPSVRRAIDAGARQPEPQGLGYFFWVGREAGDLSAHPQLMPAIACSGNECLVTYWESRERGLSANGRIGGYHRVMDLRGARLGANGTAVQSFQISRYPYRPGTRLVDTPAGTQIAGLDNVLRDETVNDIDRVNEVCTPGGTCSCTGEPGSAPPLPGLDDSRCIPRLNFYARPTSGGGTTAFVGDYNSLVPSAPFASAASPAPWAGFVLAAADNRNLIPPSAALPQQVVDYRNWQPGAGGLPYCTVGGSRNADTLLTRISFGLIVSSPETALATPAPGEEFITFTVHVANNDAVAKQVRFRILTADTATVASSFSKTISSKTGTVPVNAHSSTVREVYVRYPGGTVSPVQVEVAELVDGQAQSPRVLTFNRNGVAAPSQGTTPTSVTVSDPANLSVDNLSVDNLSVDNLSVDNLSVDNLSVDNLSVDNLSVDNLSVDNLSVDNLGIQETGWLVQATGDPTKTFIALPSIDRAYTADYEFRASIYRLGSIGACIDPGTQQVTRQYRATLIGNTGAANLSVDNLSVDNLSVDNGFPNDPVIDNLVFTASPSGSQAQASSQRAATAAAASPTCSASTGYRLGECVEAPPPAPEYVLVRLQAIPNKRLDLIARKYDPSTAPAALTVAEYWCEPGQSSCDRTRLGPDLVATQPTAAPRASVLAGQSLTIPAGQFAVTNAGTRPAGPRRYGLYLSGDDEFSLSPSTGLALASEVLVDHEGRTTELAVGSLEAVPELQVTLPATAAPGTYRLYFYADDLRTVSELREDNNVPAYIEVEVRSAPDLAVSAVVPTAAPSTVAAGETLQFPSGGYVVRNIGTQAAGTRRYGVYLSADQALDPAVDALVGEWTPTGSLAAGAQETVPARSVTIPGSTAPGTYSLFLFADDRAQVTELDETNNVTAAAALTVAPPPTPRYGAAFQCTPDPARGADCTKSGTGALPLFWQFTLAGTPVDTRAMLPTLRFYRSNSAWQLPAGSTPDQAAAATWQPLLVGLANPGDVATGASDFRYKPPTTWQYNWQRLAPDGSTLRGYFLLFLEVGDDTLASRRAIGPIRIYLP